MRYQSRGLDLLQNQNRPAPDSHAIYIRRISDIREAVNPDDLFPQNQFQELAWCRIVLGFIKAARRELDWHNNQLDRTVAAFLIALSTQQVRRRTVKSNATFDDPCRLITAYVGGAPTIMQNHLK